jgi:hypothetical protein
VFSDRFDEEDHRRSALVIVVNGRREKGVLGGVYGYQRHGNGWKASLQHFVPLL